MIKKAFSLIICCVLFCLSVSLAPLCPSAAEVDTSQSASLKIYYIRNNVKYENLEIKIYRVADVNPDLTFNLSNGFEKYPVDISNINSQDEWRGVTRTLSGYIIKDGITPTASALTDSFGMAIFTDLKVGMYLVMGVRTLSDNTVVAFESFLTALPYPNDDESYSYDTVLYPKSEQITRSNEKIGHSVLKHWKDGGYTNTRTKNIEVEIYRNDELFDTVTLSDENGWMYSWEHENDGSAWNIVEINVPKNYTVSIGEEVDSLFIQNTYHKPENPPKTGDTSHTELYIVLMTISGLSIIFVSFGMRKKA